MATFRVGQRVRKVRVCNIADWAPKEIPIGAECEFIAYVHMPKGTRNRHGQVALRDSDCRIRYGGNAFRCVSSSFEPIQPERNQTIPWSECLWQPNQQEETA